MTRKRTPRERAERRVKYVAKQLERAKQHKESVQRQYNQALRELEASTEK